MEEAFDAFLSHGFQDLLADSFSNFEMDPAMLQAVVDSNNSLLLSNGDGSARGSMAGMKRDLDEDEDEEEDGKPNKKPRSSKAEKEKARRDRINSRFIDLAKLIDPTSSDKDKSERDKTAILADAIRFIQLITCENHQLKQVNKFMEEKVGCYERERSYYLYQQTQGGPSATYPPPWAAFPPPLPSAAPQMMSGNGAGPSCHSGGEGAHPYPNQMSLPMPFHHGQPNLFPPPGSRMFPLNPALNVSIPSVDEPTPSSLVLSESVKANAPTPNGTPRLSPFSSIPPHPRSIAAQPMPKAPQSDLDRPPAA